MPSSRSPSPPPAAQPDESTRIADMFKNMSAQGEDTPSVAPWLLQDFASHKERLIKG